MKYISRAALSLFAAALSARAANIYYASPAGGGDGSSPSSPTNLAAAVSLARTRATRSS